MFFRRRLKLFAFPLAHATFELHYNKLVHKLSPARVFHNSWTSSVEGLSIYFAVCIASERAPVPSTCAKAYWPWQTQQSGLLTHLLTHQLTQHEDALATTHEAKEHYTTEHMYHADMISVWLMCSWNWGRACPSPKTSALRGSSRPSSGVETSAPTYLLACG